ncbi:MAG: hypothetical protein JSR59_03075 [Proteobacteria bacterium]|nr:hypothetical protein [Pseudomonadota bacterium]
MDTQLDIFDDSRDVMLRRQFDAGFEGSGDIADLAWLPAWVLTDEPRLASLLAPAQPSRHTDAEQAMRLLVELIGLERQGRQHDIVDRRRRLRDLNGSLYAAYLRTR